MSKKSSLFLSIVALSIAGIALGISVKQFFDSGASAGFMYMILAFGGALISGINLLLYHNKLKKRNE